MARLHPACKPSGWIRQKPDPRDWKFVPPKRLTRRTPQSYDLVPGMGPKLNQGGLGSCGPNTVAEMVDYDQKSEGLSVDTPSRLHVYYFTRKLMGTVGQDSGVDNRTMLQALAQYGFISETQWPYVESKFKQAPPTAVQQAALANRISNYAAVEQTQDGVTGTIFSGHPFILGFDCFQQIMSDQAATTGILTTPSSNDTPIGGHDVGACSFNLTSSPLPGIQSGNIFPPGTVRFRNHWVNEDGTPWGDGGYGYMPIGYVLGANASDFWVINAIPGAIQPPTPPTPPTPTPVGDMMLQIAMRLSPPHNVPTATYTMTPVPSKTHLRIMAMKLGLSIPPEILAWIDKEGSVVVPVVLADLPAVLLKQKTWLDVLKDVEQAVAQSIMVNKPAEFLSHLLK